MPATITKEATLTLGQEVPAAIAPTPPATNPIAGTMTVTLATPSNALSGTLTLTGDFARVTEQPGVHIHRGIIGESGGIVVGLQKVGDGTTWSIPAGTLLEPADAALFKAGSTYVNAHTALNPAGEIRGQLLGFADNIQPIFTVNCAVSGCHLPGTTAPMSLAAGASVASLVNQPATYSPGQTRVVPGDSANSVLFKRITGATAGLPMPPGTQLPANERNLITVWIDMGAKDN